MKLRFAEIENAIRSVERAEKEALDAQQFEQAAGLVTALNILRRIGFHIDQPAR